MTTRWLRVGRSAAVAACATMTGACSLSFPTTGDEADGGLPRSDAATKPVHDAGDVIDAKGSVHHDSGPVRSHDGGSAIDGGVRGGSDGGSSADSGPEGSIAPVGDGGVLPSVDGGVPASDGGPGAPDGSSGDASDRGDATVVVTVEGGAGDSSSAVDAANDAGDATEAGPVNPCLGGGGCDPNASCAVALGSAVCTCNQGYAGSGQTCSAIDNCQSFGGGCDPNAACTSTGPGTNSCACDPGYVGSGTTCVPNPCNTGNGGCDANATCNGLSGTPVCECHEGFVGSGITCSVPSPLVPIAVTASSQEIPWPPTNAENPDFAGWMSAIQSDNAEWIQYDYGTPVYVTGVQAYVLADRQGSGEILQGSNDASTWTTIYTFDDTRFVWTDPSAPLGDTSYLDAVTDAQGYRYVRLWSAPSPYLFYSWLQLSGGP